MYKKKEQLHLSLTSHINEEDFEHEEEEMSRLLKKKTSETLLHGLGECISNICQ